MQKFIDKKNLIRFVLVTLVVAGIAGGVYAFQTIKDKPKKTTTTVETTVNDNSSAQVAPATAQAPTNEQKDVSVAPVEKVEAKIVPPMDNFNGRITLNPFGNQPSKMQIDESQYTDLVCAQGKNYPGYHTGVDLELSPAERVKEISVYSISDGLVRQAGYVNGYGGLIVVEYDDINGQTYTAYYGHTDISTFTVKAGDKVKAGQKLAELAPACTNGNGNTRKHLHFGIHKGKEVVVAGYVNSKQELSNWVDPRDIIK